MSEPSITDELNSIHYADVPSVARQFKTRRNAHGLSQIELVREAGYSNINKGLCRIRHLESASSTAPDHRVIKRFAFVLGIDLAELAGELRARRQERQDDNIEPVPPWSLGSLLRHARNERGLSIPEVAERADLPPSDRWKRWIEQLESGEFRLTLLRFLGHDKSGNSLCLSFFKASRTYIVERRVASLSVVEDLDELEDLRSCFVS